MVPAREANASASQAITAIDATKRDAPINAPVLVCASSPPMTLHSVSACMALSAWTALSLVVREAADTVSAS